MDDKCKGFVDFAMESAKHIVQVDENDLMSISEANSGNSRLEKHKKDYVAWMKYYFPHYFKGGAER